MSHLEASLTVTVRVPYFQNHSRLSDQEIQRRIWDECKEERELLAAAMRTSAILILAGDNPDD